MGMYTECRGFIELEYDSMNTDEFNDLMAKAETLSPRVHFCISSTIFNIGSNCVPFIFIGGELKNYDNDWEIFLKFLLNNLKVIDHKIETQYEEDLIVECGKLETDGKIVLGTLKETGIIPEEVEKIKIIDGKKYRLVEDDNNVKGESQ